MKTTTSSARKRTHSAQTARKTPARRPRPLHKRVLLHPFSIMILLCTGVIIVGSTFRTHADSYDVTATVPAIPPSSPAFIQEPYDLQHVSSVPSTVTGSCPAASYVKLYRQSVFSGVATCTNQTFHIQTDLSVGANQLQAKVYNFTNQEGPQSPAVTVYYDPTTIAPQPPTDVPTTLTIQNVEKSDYKQGSIQQTSINPTISGFAPPYAHVMVTFHSVVTTCLTQADGRGWWACTLDQPLPPGIHWVEIEATGVDGAHWTVPKFQIRVMSGLPNVLKPHNPSAPLLILSEYQFQTHYVGQPFTWKLGLNGGTAPYILSVDWGDGSQSPMTRYSGATFIITHAYPEVKTYPLFIKSTDAKGTTAILQLNAVVKGQSIGVASLTAKGPIASLFAGVQRYLWIVWPVYVGVILMAFSYWLGEQEIYQRARQRHLARMGKGR